MIECLVDEGDTVEPGAPLARLESDRLAAEQAQTEAKLSQAQARLDELVAGPRAQTISSMREQVAELTALRDLALAKKERSDKLHEKGAITDQDQEQYYFDYLSIESRLSSLKEQLNELKKGPAEQIKAQQGMVQELEAELNAIKIDIEDTLLTAPFAGTIIARDIDEGEVVTAGQMVFELIEDQNLEIWVGVPVELSSDVLSQDSFAITIGEELYRWNVSVYCPV
ncbi:MAG: HlyD family efflux transporter periplasmic adaptor subunit [Planctomycetaceae bacterium]